MRKDLLLSLLATGAAPLGAYADVNVTALVEQAGWDITGVDISVIDGKDIIAEKGVTSTSAAAQLKVKLEALPEGTYTLVLWEGFNQNVKVECNGATNWDDENKEWINELKFTVEKYDNEKPVILTVSSADQMHGFTVRIKSLFVDVENFQHLGEGVNGSTDNLITMDDHLTNPYSPYGYIRFDETQEQWKNVQGMEESQTSKDLNKDAAAKNEKLDEMDKIVKELKGLMPANWTGSLEQKIEQARQNIADAEANLATQEQNVKDAEAAVEKAKENVEKGEQALQEAKDNVAAAEQEVEDAQKAWEDATKALTRATAIKTFGDWNYNRALENYNNANGAIARSLAYADLKAAEKIKEEADKNWKAAVEEEAKTLAALGAEKVKLEAAKLAETAADAALNGVDHEEVYHPEVYHEKVVLVEAHWADNPFYNPNWPESSFNLKQIWVHEIAIPAWTEPAWTEPACHFDGLKDIVAKKEKALEDAKTARDQAADNVKAAEDALDNINDTQVANEARILELWKEYNELADVLDNGAEATHDGQVADEDARYQRQIGNYKKYNDFKPQLDRDQQTLNDLKKAAEDLAKLEEDVVTSTMLHETVNAEEESIKIEVVEILNKYVGYPLDYLKADLEEAQNTINNLYKEIEETYTEGIENGKVKKYADNEVDAEVANGIQEKIDAVETNNTALKNKYADAVDDVKAKTKLDQYKQNLASVMDTDTHDLQDVRDGLAADVMDQLQALFDAEDAALDEAIARDWHQAAENADADYAAYQNTLLQMNELMAGIHNILSQNEKAYAELMKYIADPEGTENDGSVVKGIADVKAKLTANNIQDPTTKELLEKYLNGIEDELAALQAQVEDEYEHYNLKYPDGEEEFTHENEVKNLLNKITALDKAIGNAADYDGFLAEITGLQSDLEEARKAIKAEVTVKVDDVDAEAVAVAFDDTYYALKKSLELYNKRITESLKAEVTEDDLAEIASSGLTQEEKDVLVKDIAKYKEEGVKAAKKYNEELVLCSTLLTETGSLKATVEEWSKKENGKYVYAIDAEKSKLAAWGVEAADYETLVNKYKDEVVKLLADHAEHDANNFIKAVNAFDNAAVSGEINKVAGKEVMTIAQLNAEYFAGKRVDFAINGVVADNLEALNALYAEYEAVNDAAKYGQVGLDGFKAELQNWKKYIDDLTAQEAAYEQNDAQIKNLEVNDPDKAYEPAVVAQYWQYVADKADHLKKAETSQKNKNTLDVQKTAIVDSVAPAIAAAKAEVDEITRTRDIEANKYYKEELGKLDKKYTDKVAEVVAAYTAEYNAIAKDQNWVENDGINNADYDNYKKQLEDVEAEFKAAVAALVSDCRANEAAHNGLLEKEQNTIREINAIIDWFKTLEENEVKVEGMTRDDIIEALTELKNENTEELPGVSKVNNEVIASYSKGENDDEYDALWKKYDALKKKAEWYKALIMDQYQNAVWTANREFADNLFGPKYAELLKLFKNGVDTFEAYAYCKAVVEETHNADYEIAIREYLTRNDHAKDIYAYSALIIELENEVDALVEEVSNYTTDEKNPAELHELSLADFRMLLGKYDLYKGDADLENTPADVPFNGMIGYATYIAEQANNFAMKWLTEDVTVVDDDLNVIAGKYNGEGALDVAVTTIENALNGFAAQGISESVQEVYTKEAKALYETAKMQIIAALGVNIGTEETPNIVNQLSQHMCTILETLSKINVDVEAAAYSHWSNELKAAKIRFTEIKALVNAINASGVDVTAQLAQLEGVESSIWGENGIKAYVEKDYADGILLGAVKRYVDDLKNEMAEAENALKDAEAAKAKAVANAQALAQFKEDLEALKEAYNELCAGVGGLDLTLEQFRIVYTVGVEEQIDALEAALDGKYKYCANDMKDKVQKMFDDAYEAIQNSYTAAWVAQKENLDELMHITRYAFDVVKAANTDKYGEVTDADKLDRWNADMDELAQIIAENSSEMVWFNAMVKPAVILDNLSTAEGDLEEILQKILKYAAENGIEFNEESGITEWLENDVEGVATSIQDAINVLDENYNDVKEAYEAADAVLGQLEDAGFYTSGNYKEDVEAFNDLMTQLDAEKAQWEKEGDFVVLTEPRHSRNINAIDEKIAEYKAKFQKAVDLEKAHKARLKVLQSEINTLETAYNNVLKAIDTYEKVTEADYKEIYADGIELYLQMSKDDLADADENKYLVEWRDNVIEETYANYWKTAIEILIKDLDEKMLALEVDRQQSAAQDLVDKINEIFVGDDFADMIGLNAQLDDINEQNDKLQPAYVGQIVEIFEEEYEITLEDIQSLSHEVVDAAKKLLADLKENAIVRGDVSLDGKVSVLDYNQLLRMILTSNNKYYDQADKKKVSADVNKNERIDVADITTLVNILTGKTNTTAQARMRTQAGQNNLELAYVAEQNGVRRMAVNLNSVNNLVNAQMELVLPEGLTVVGATAADRINGLDLHTYDMEDGRYRIVIASAELQTIEAGEGALFFLDIEGSASSDITVSEALASDANAATYELGAQGASVTGINTITDAVIGGVKKVYNMGGQMIDSMRNGINIMVGNGGKGKKVIKK